MNCKDAQRELSGYLDRALDWKRASEIRGHLTACAECAGEAAQLDSVRQLFRSHGRVTPPKDLALQVRLRVARESAPSISAWTRMMVRLQNLLGPVAIPASTGLLSTALIFGTFVYNFGVPLNTTNDIPLALQTPPKLLAMPQINFTTSDEGVMVLCPGDFDLAPRDFDKGPCRALLDQERGSNHPDGHRTRLDLEGTAGVGHDGVSGSSPDELDAHAGGLLLPHAHLGGGGIVDADLRAVGEADQPGPRRGGGGLRQERRVVGGGPPAKDDGGDGDGADGRQRGGGDQGPPNARAPVNPGLNARE